MRVWRTRFVSGAFVAAVVVSLLPISSSAIASSTAALGTVHRIVFSSESGWFGDLHGR